MFPHRHANWMTGWLSDWLLVSVFGFRNSQHLLYLSLRALLWWFRSENLVGFYVPSILWYHSLPVHCLSGHYQTPPVCAPDATWTFHLTHTVFHFVLNRTSSIIYNNFSSNPKGCFIPVALLDLYVQKQLIVKLPSHVTGFAVWCHTIQSGRSFCQSNRY